MSLETQNSWISWTVKTEKLYADIRYLTIKVKYLYRNFRLPSTGMKISNYCKFLLVCVASKEPLSSKCFNVNMQTEVYSSKFYYKARYVELFIMIIMF